MSTTFRNPIGLVMSEVHRTLRHIRMNMRHLRLVCTRWRPLAALLPLVAVATIGSTSAAQLTETNLAGEWKLEFRSAGTSADLQARPAPWLTFTATVVQLDSTVGAAMRSDGPSGQFGCKRRVPDVCTAGRMRLSWDEQDWQTFEFQLTPGSVDKGSGRAEIRFPTGQTDRYTFVMTRVR